MLITSTCAHPSVLTSSLHTHTELARTEVAQRLGDVQELRRVILSASDKPDQLRGLLAKYYQSLTVLQQQFPVGRKSEGIPVEFTWYDAFQTNKRAVSNSIAYEKACVLFNLAAVCSQESLASDLTTDGGLKSSARHFQDAAGYFKLLHDVVAPQLDDVPSFDISIDSTEMLELLMLAQAQESFLQKATRDKKNPAVLARLAAQVSQYYNDIEELNSISQLRKYLGQVWTAHVHVKRNLFAAVAQQRNAEVQMADDECGNALACLQPALPATAVLVSVGTVWISNPLLQLQTALAAACAVPVAWLVGLILWIETGEGILAYGGVDFSAYREGANPRAVMGNRPATLRYMENNYDNDTCGSGYERIWYTGQPDDPKSSQVPGYLALPGGGRAKNIKARVARWRGDGYAEEEEARRLKEALDAVEIYLLTAPNGKQYVGQAQLYRRAAGKWEAHRLIEEAHKAAGKDWRGPAVDKDLAHTVEYYQGSIADAIEKANTDNARIYFQRVPSSVPAVQPAVMVNSAAPTGLTQSLQWSQLSWSILLLPQAQQPVAHDDYGLGTDIVAQAAAHPLSAPFAELITSPLHHLRPPPALQDVRGEWAYIHRPGVGTMAIEPPSASPFKKLAAAQASQQLHYGSTTVQVHQGLPVYSATAERQVPAETVATAMDQDRRNKKQPVAKYVKEVGKLRAKRKKEEKPRRRVFIAPSATG
ncbi:hypothetical protein WJX77_003609 [Trebouxia sp. C0004]